jgi:phosphoribosylglycinamide formyltransferase-1
MSKSADDPRRARVTKLCLSFPETNFEYHGAHGTYRVRKKAFVYYLDNHHGDGIVCVAAKVGPGDNQALVASQPDRFCMPAYIASRGWVSLRFDRSPIDWDEVRELVATSYVLVAPKKLAAEVLRAGADAR